MRSSSPGSFAADARFISGFAKPFASAIGCAALLALAQYGAGLTVPWLSGRLTNTLLEAPAGSGGILDWLFVALIAALVVQNAIGFGLHALTASVETSLAASLRAKEYDHLQSLPLSYFHSNRVGNLLSLIVYDAEQLARFVSMSLALIVPQVLTFLAAWILMMRIDLALGLAAGLTVPLFIAAARLLLRRMRKLSTEVAESHDRMLSHAESHLDAILLLKAFDRGADSAAEFSGKSADLAALEKRVALSLSQVQPILSTISGVAVVSLLWLLSRKLTAGALGAGELVSFLMYGYFLAKPMASLATFYGQFQLTRATVERLRALFDAGPEDCGGDRSVESLRGIINFRKVSFSYPGRPPAIDGLNLDIRAGETIAIVGPNGAGKSTLAHLLFRFADPDDGSILIDGHPIREFELSCLRANIGLVTQTVLLLDGTVAENIRFGRAGASDDEIFAAARKAQADEFIQELPNGYDTTVGEHGVRLSGGQRQRIALARALLKNPPILILDEATGQFDPEAEKRFLETAARELESFTVIVITHHAAAQSIAGRIVRMENGKVVSEQRNTPPPRLVRGAGVGD
ncbi:MAG: ABC transporter ATP-binding protein [Gammaproteobacteria bacterium]|nr:ABC transporter ATP-binding protein [Gammaproteobacteria bacterium]